MDKISSSRRSENMRKIKSKNTKPEIIVRKLIFNMGYRYRLHVNDLPGKPDLVFNKKKKVIFVNGCFWHSHNQNCKFTHTPLSNQTYWFPKLTRTKQRDLENQNKLIELGYNFLIIWECELENKELLSNKIKSFLH